MKEFLKKVEKFVEVCLMAISAYAGPLAIIALVVITVIITRCMFG